MRKYFGGAAVACVATMSVVALSGCSVSLEDATSDAETTMGDRFGESTRAPEGQAHDPKGKSGSSGAGAGRGTGGADDSSSGRPGAQEKGRPAGEGARPAGHEGLWFDSEPTDPWDRYVWKSQKYIGKGGDIPKLGPGTADKAFWGLPDLCSRQMQLRMKDVGFEFRERVSFPDEAGCWSLFDGSANALVGGGVAKFSYGEPETADELPGQEGDRQLPDGWKLLKSGHSGGARCVVVGEVGFTNGLHARFQSLVDGSLEQLDTEEECSRSIKFASIVINSVH